MSMMLMVQAMKSKVGNPLRKLVLIKLADNANDDGECWPSHKNIADHCEISVRSVIRHIAELEKAGFMTVDQRFNGAGKSSNLYRIHFNKVTESHKHSDRESQPPSDRESHRISHSFEPVNESTPTPSPDGLEEADLDTATPVNKKTKTPPIPYDEIRDLYHEVLPEFPRSTVWSPKRKTQIKGRWEHSEHTCSLDWWREYFEFIRDQGFLMQAARERRGWINLEFLTNPNKFADILDGKYREARA